MKVTKGKIKSAILIFLLFSLALVVATPQEAFAETKKPYKVRELTELRTDNTKVFELSDGNKAYEVHANRVHYKDETGKYADIDNTIMPTDGTDQKELFKNKANDFKVSFGNNDKKPCVTLKKDGYSIEMSITDSKNGCKFESTNSIPKGKSEYLDVLSERNNSLQVKGILQDLDAVYTVENDKVKEDIIIYQRTSLPDLSFTIKCSNLNLVKKTETMTGYDEDTREESAVTKDIWYFEDPSTKTQVFTINDFVMVDSEGKYSDILKWDYIQKGNTYHLTVYPDNEFLQNPNTVYPVTLDPSVYGSSSTYDVYVCDRYTGTNYNSGSQMGYLRTGRDSSYYRRRTFIRYDLPLIPHNEPISTCYIDLYKYSYSGATTLQMYLLTTSWDSSVITWGTSPDCEANPRTVSTYNNSPSTGWYRIGYNDFNHVVRGWYVGLYSNYGVKLKDVYESGTSVWTTFCSSDYSGSTYDPVLVINTFIGNTEWLRSTGGYQSNAFTVKNNLTSYSGYLDAAVSAWNAAYSNINISISASSSNEVWQYYDSSDIDRYGYYNSYGQSPASEFEIALNTYMIDGAKEWNGYARSVITHELGHALWLANMAGEEYCIMGSGRDKDTFFYPSKSDIAGIQAKWPIGG